MVEINELLQVLRLPTVKLFRELKKRPYAIAGKHYVLWHRGEGLPCLVAHIDHVYEEKGWDKRPILYNEEYIWSPSGTAGDDRAGVYAVMKLFEVLEVNALFTDCEEKGGIGAWEACEEPKLSSVPYFIEIDRRGERQAVFYNNEEILLPEFARIISKYFQIERGTFSDISILGQSLNVASVNLSAGFYNEHQQCSEYIHIPSLQYTIETIPKLIEELGDKRYELPEPLWSYYSYSYWSRGKGKGKGKRRASSSLFWWYEPEETGIKNECPIECWSCGAIDWDRVVGYWCWNIEDSPDPEHPNCIRKKFKEVEPWM